MSDNEEDSGRKPSPVPADTTDVEGFKTYRDWIAYVTRRVPQWNKEVESRCLKEAWDTQGVVAMKGIAKELRYIYNKEVKWGINPDAASDGIQAELPHPDGAVRGFNVFLQRIRAVKNRLNNGPSKNTQDTTHSHTPSTKDTNHKKNNKNKSKKKKNEERVNINNNNNNNTLDVDLDEFQDSDLENNGNKDDLMSNGNETGSTPGNGGSKGSRGTTTTDKDDNKEGNGQKTVTYDQATFERELEKRNEEYKRNLERQWHERDLAQRRKDREFEEKRREDERRLLERRQSRFSNTRSDPYDDGIDYAAFCGGGSRGTQDTDYSDVYQSDHARSGRIGGRNDYNMRGGPPPTHQAPPSQHYTGYGGRGDYYGNGNGWGSNYNGRGGAPPPPPPPPPPPRDGRRGGDYERENGFNGRGGAPPPPPPPPPPPAGDGDGNGNGNGGDDGRNNRNNNHNHNHSNDNNNYNPPRPVGGD